MVLNDKCDVRKLVLKYYVETVKPTFLCVHLKCVRFLNIGEGAGKNTLIKVGSSKVTMGKPYDFPSYGWDNEYGEWTEKYEYCSVSSSPGHPQCNREI